MILPLATDNDKSVKKRASRTHLGRWLDRAIWAALLFIAPVFRLVGATGDAIRIPPPLLLGGWHNWQDQRLPLG